MVLRRLLAQVAAVFLLAGCTHGENALYGSYVAHDMALEHFNPPVTLTLARSHRYRFCVGERCATGGWSLRDYGRNGSRIVLVGPEVERWMRAFLVKSYGADAFPQPWPAQGEIESDYSNGPLGVQITLGAGDAAFVKE